MNATRTCKRPMAIYLYPTREDRHESPMTINCRTLDDARPINWQFAATLALLAAFVLLLISAGVDYAANIDALALKGGAGGF